MSDISQRLQEAACGNPDAFDDIVRHYQNRVVAYAYTLLGSRERAQDVAQEAFLQAWRDLPMLRDTTTFGAWLRRIVFKFADRDRRRAHTTVSLDTIAETADETSPLREVIRSNRQARVRDMIATLPDGERAVITLFYMGSHRVSEVGSFLGLTETTVKKRLERARKRLAERMVAIVNEELGEMAPSQKTRFVEMARLLRQVTQVLEQDPHVLAAYLAPFGMDEGFGAGNDAWASLNVHAVLRDEAMPALATGRKIYVSQISQPILWVEAQQNAPPHGYYLMAIYDAPAGPYEVDWYWHRMTDTSLPTDARVLFNRGAVSVGAMKQKWDFTAEDAYPEAIRQVWASRTPEEARAEETRNTVHLFWAMWLIAAKYSIRGASETELPFAPMLRNLIADTHRNIERTDGVEPQESNVAPTREAKLALLQRLADEMTALQQSPPDAVPRFLELVERSQ